MTSYLFSVRFKFTTFHSQRISSLNRREITRFCPSFIKMSSFQRTSKSVPASYSWTACVVSWFTQQASLLFTLMIKLAKVAKYKVHIFNTFSLRTSSYGRKIVWRPLKEKSWSFLCWIVDWVMRGEGSGGGGMFSQGEFMVTFYRFKLRHRICREINLMNV